MSLQPNIFSERISGTLLDGVTNISTNTISATTYYNLPIDPDYYVTGGTFSGTTLTLNRQNGSVLITGFTSTSIDTYTTGFTYSNNNLSILQNGGQPPLNVNISLMTGLTVNGNSNFNTVTATSLSNLNYIDFNTGTTSPTNVSGRVFYDDQSHSLAYYSNIANVKVEMGQQLYIRGFNNTGSIIPKGTVLSIQTSTNSLPNFIPLVINHKAFSQVVGLAASDIPINSDGLALSQGILSGITINSFNIGDILYASPFSAGTYVTSTTTFPFSARTNQVGFVIATGTTTGEIYVSINNENENLTLTDIERNILEGNITSTGVYEFTGMTTASTTTFNIAPMRGWLVKNTYEYATSPDVVNLYYPGGTNISVTNLASANSTYILITSALTVTQQVTFPTPQQRRENIFLGKVNHPNRSTILNINNTVDYDVSPMSSLRDLWSPIKLINQGIIPSPNGANLSFNTSAGVLWGNGINWHNNQLSPNNVSIPAKVVASFNYRTQSGGTSSSVTVIDPRNYDVDGVITSIGNAGLDDSTNQRIYMYPTGVINVLYGQTKYTNLAAAVAGIQSETFIVYPNAESNGILIGILSVRNDIGTDGENLTNTNYAKFTLVSKFGESFGGTGGLSTTTLQQAYNNSTNPEIVTNSTLNSVQFRGGTGSDTDKNISIENNAGVLTGWILGNGGATFSSVSATTYYNLPIDPDNYVTGGTYSNGSLTLNRQNGLVTVTGLTSNDTYVTGFTYSNNNLTISQNQGQSPLSVNISTMTGLTVNGGVTGTTLNSTGDVIAQQYVKVLNSVGDEGGEIFLNKAVTNTTINNGVTIDIYQNKLRFFEQGGTARGFYLDITTGGNGVATNLSPGAVVTSAAVNLFNYYNNI